MAALIVVYNVHDDARRAALHSHITSVPNVKLSESVYLVLSTDTQMTAYLALKEHIRTEDDLLVSKFDPQTFGWHRADVVSWVNTNAMREP